MRGYPLDEAMQRVFAKYGSLRATAAALQISVGYLSRLANGGKTAPSAEVLKKLKLKATPLYQLVESTETEDIDNIPDGVYFSMLSDNFYSRDGQGMGADFYMKWRHRRREFPKREGYSYETDNSSRRRPV